MEDAFARSADEVLANFQVDSVDGLSDAQVADLRNKHGRNCTSTLASSIPRDRPATNLRRLALTSL